MLMLFQFVHPLLRGGFGESENLNKSSFNIPDWLAFLPPVAGLLGAGPDFPDIPDLKDFGVDPESIGKFFNLRRMVARAGLQRQGAQATRAAVGNLPSSLSQSTIPASISADIQTRVGDQIAGTEAELAGQEQNALLQAYNTMLQKFGLEADIAKSERSDFFDIMDVAAFLPLFL